MKRAGDGSGKAEPRVVAVLSFALEANVFNPVPRRLSSFSRLQGDEYRTNYRQAGFVQLLANARPELFEDVVVEFVCLFRGFCGGLIPADDFQHMKDVATQGLRRLKRVDAVFLDLHGAMGVAGYGAEGDAEAEIVEAVRAALGNSDLLISASFDLHGNFSRRLGNSLDIVTAYKTMPHKDMEETKTKGLSMLLSQLQQGARRASTSIVMLKIPAVMSGDVVVTTEEPGRRLYECLKVLEIGTPGLLDASLFVGHQHADEARLGGTVVLTCESNVSAAMRQHAQTIARDYWDARTTFQYPGACMLQSWENSVKKLYECFDQNVQLLVGDFGDNVCAGAPGDVPFALCQLLKLSAEQRDGGHPEVLVAGLVDAEAVEACIKAGVGAELESLQVGAALTSPLGHSYGEDCESLNIPQVKVRAIVNNNAWAVISVRNLTVVLQKVVWAFFGPWDFDHLPTNLRPNKFSATVAKFGINLEDLLDDKIADPAAKLGFTCCILANTPGACTEPLPDRVHLQRPMYPLDKDMVWDAPLGSLLSKS